MWKGYLLKNLSKEKAGYANVTMCQEEANFNI